MKPGVSIAVLIFLSALFGGVLAQGTDYDLTWKYGTGEWVRTVAISAAGEYIAAGTQDTNLYLFNDKGELQWKYKTRSFINSVAISADGTYIAAGSDDRNVYLLDRNKTILWLYDVKNKSVDLVSISRDGKFVAAASDETLHFFSRRGVIPLWSFKIGGVVYGLAVSPNGSTITAWSKDRNVYLFDRDGNLLWSYNLESIEVSGPPISSEGKFAAAVPRFNKVYFFTLQGNLRRILELNDEVTGISMLSNDSIIVAKTAANEIYFFSTEGDLLKKSSLNVSLGDISISDNGTYIATSYKHPDGNVYLFSESLEASEKDSNVSLSKKPRIVLMANSIDMKNAIELIEFLKENGVEVVHAAASDSNQYQNERLTVILGGPDAPEGIGEQVQQVLTYTEENAVRKKGAKKIYIKPNGGDTGQKVVVIAGSNRAETKSSSMDHKEQILSEALS